MCVRPRSSYYVLDVAVYIPWLPREGLDTRGVERRRRCDDGVVILAKQQHDTTAVAARRSARTSSTTRSLMAIADHCR